MLKAESLKHPQAYYVSPALSLLNKCAFPFTLLLVPLSRGYCRNILRMQAYFGGTAVRLHAFGPALAHRRFSNCRNAALIYPLMSTDLHIRSDPQSTGVARRGHGRERISRPAH